MRFAARAATTGRASFVSAAFGRSCTPLHRGHRRHCTCIAPGAVGRSPSSIAEAFFKSATGTDHIYTAASLAESEELEGDAAQQEPEQVTHRARGPDAVVAFLCDDIIAAAFEHARNLRMPEETIDVTLDLCLQAAHTNRVPVESEDPEKPSAPFLDTYAERALKYAGVAQYHLLSSMSVSQEQHVARYKVVMKGGEEAALTFYLCWESVVRAAYRGIASEQAWALQRVRGDCLSFRDAPHWSMGPEGSLHQHLAALKVGNVESAYKFISHTVYGNTKEYQDQLESPLFRPLLSHVGAKVLKSRHSSASRMSAVVKVLPDPRRGYPTADLMGASASDALFYFTLTNDDDSKPSPQSHESGGWVISEVKVVPMQFVNAWPRKW